MKGKINTDRRPDKISRMLKVNDFRFLSLFLSVLFHTAIGVLLFILMRFNFQKDPLKGGYVNVNLAETPVSTDQTIKEDETAGLSDELIENNPDQIIEEKYFLDLSDDVSDTSSLEQVYAEPTLNVEMKYPAGWTYVDQNVKNKLDGVTFWMNSDKYKPPPYIHLEVKEKYLFNSNRYSDSLKLRNFTLYYNEPEETAGYITQVVYIRTNTEEDFSIKLMMVGADQFKSFQPTFFTIVKSFKFNNSPF